MPSSVNDGSRPRMLSRRWYSSPLKPCSAMSSGSRPVLFLASMALAASVARCRAYSRPAPPCRGRVKSLGAILNQVLQAAVDDGRGCLPAGQGTAAGDGLSAQAGIERPVGNDLAQRGAQRCHAPARHDPGATPADPGAGGASVGGYHRQAVRQSLCDCHAIAFVAGGGGIKGGGRPQPRQLLVADLTQGLDSGGHTPGEWKGVVEGESGWE